jgi:hypothetical protein
LSPHNLLFLPTPISSFTMALQGVSHMPEQRLAPLMEKFAEAVSTAGVFAPRLAITN